MGNPEQDLAELSIDELAEAVARGTAEQAAHLARWLALVAEFDRRDGHLAFGMRSCAQWLSWRCGLDGRTARDHVRVANRLVDLPLLRAELAAGRLSYSKVRAVSRAADQNTEELLVSLAGDLSAAQLERVVAQYAALRGPELTKSDDDLRRRQCGVTRWVDREGLVHHEIISTPDDAGLIDAALSFGGDSLFEAAKTKAKEAKEDAQRAKREARLAGDEGASAASLGGSAGSALGGSAGSPDVVPIEKPPVPRLSRARQQLEALVWVLRRGMINANRDDLVDESRYLVMLHVREGQAMVTDEGRVDLGNGLAVLPRTLQRLGCGSLLQGMLSGVDGRPLDLGDRVRLATRNQRVALKAMYPTCEIPGCDVPFDWCEVHHVVPWEVGGPTDVANLRPRCRYHHHLVHEGGWREVLGADGRTVLLPPDGRAPVVPSPPLTAAPVRPTALVEANRAHGAAPPDDLTTLGGAGAGERLADFAFAMIIEALFEAGPPVDGSGLLDEHFVGTTLRGRLAIARRSLRPLAVVCLEVLETEGGATTVPVPEDEVARVLRRTLREADVAGRGGRGAYTCILEDTGEDGAVWTAERLRRNLCEGGRARRFRAGVAAYPAHGLEAEELEAKAQAALAAARDWTTDRIEVAPGG